MYCQRHKTILGSNEDKLAMNCAILIVNKQLKNLKKKTFSHENLKKFNDFKKNDSYDTLDNYVKNNN